MKKDKKVLVYILIALIMGFVIGRSSFSAAKPPLAMPQPISCIYNGHTYQNGEGFKNDCNTCSCAQGQVICTLMACSAP